MRVWQESDQKTAGHCSDAADCINMDAAPNSAKVQPVAAAPADSVHAITLTVTLPYTRADFTSAKQTSFKAAMAAAAGTVASNVDILSITEGRRRAGSIAVETKIRALDAAGLTVLENTLGSDASALTAKINTELKAQGLEESTGVTVTVDAAKTGAAAQCTASNTALVLATAAVSSAISTVSSG